MPKLKKPKKPTKKDLKRKLWKLTSSYVRTIEPSCYTCGKYIPDIRERHAGHYWTKGGHRRTEFDLMNVHTQCISCNCFKSGNLASYSSKLLKQYGVAEYEALEIRAHDSTPLSVFELEGMIEHIQARIKKLQTSLFKS